MLSSQHSEEANPGLNQREDKKKRFAALHISSKFFDDLLTGLLRQGCEHSSYKTQTYTYSKRNRPRLRADSW